VLRLWPEGDRDALVAEVVTEHRETRWAKELGVMADVVRGSWEERARREAAQAAAQAAREQLRLLRGLLRTLLEDRFGALPGATARQIEAVEDAEQLQALIRRVVRVQSLAEMGLG
jgi:hypothetical protein